MNKTADKFLLAVCNFVPVLHLRQSGFTYSPCESFTKPGEGIQKSRDTDNLKHNFKNELEKTCFSHDAAYSDSKDATKRTMSDKILKDKA